MKEEIYIQFLTPLPLSSLEDGKKLLEIWETFLPQYLPDSCGNCDPVDKAFDLRKRDAILEHWKWPFLAKRKNPRMESSVWMRKGSILQHASWKFVFRLGEVDVDALAEFVRRAASGLEVDFACLTLLTRTEIETGRHNGTVLPLDRKGSQFNFGVTSQDIQKYIPDVYWLTIFGQPYVSMFGKNKLLHAPVHHSKAISDTMISLQLTTALEDMRNDTQAFENSKWQLKSFLGRSAFFSSEQFTKHLVPDFIWK